MLIMISPTRYGLLCASLALLIASLAHADDPQISSWLTAYSGRYARIYTSDADKSSGNSVTTWSNGSQTQANPAYCGVQEIYSSSNYVYVRSTGLGSHVLGPWYLNAAHTQVFPNYPVNTKTFWRFPRTNTIPATKTQTSLGTIGMFVDGVAMFDSSDGFVWTGSSESGNGTGYWHREAYANEGVTFDPGYAHQEQTGTHHYHANPIALRYQLGDHVDYNTTTKTYSESTNAPTKHSPILGWVRDGLPIYGPYGYSNATNSASGIRRMIGGFQLRNGQNGTDNLTNTARATIPAWAQRLYNVSAAQAGPVVSSTYPLGRYMEDYAYLADLTNSATGTNYQQGVDFDLNEYNVRWCVTPEFPTGTYAYFVCIESNGTPKYPNNIGRAYYGNPSGGSVSSITETVATNFLGSTNIATSISDFNATDNIVTLTWKGIEGGYYAVQTSTDLRNWSNLATNLQPVLETGSFSNAANSPNQFYRLERTGTAAFDSADNTTGGDSSGYGILNVSPTNAARGTTFTLTINLDLAVNPPPQNAPIISVTVGTVTGTSNTHVSQTQVTSSITVPTGATVGTKTVSVVFPGPPENPTATVTYSLTNGFNFE